MARPNTRGPGAPSGRATGKDVARLAGVDASLVSKIMNNHPGLSVSPATRERVLAAVAELGYRPSPRARGLRLSKTWTIGAIFPDLRNPVYVSIVEGARSRAAAHGYGFILGTADGPPGAGQEKIEQLLQDEHVDGLIIASGEVSDSRLLKLASGLGPVVIVNRQVPGAASSVLVDDEAGSALAAEHLFGLGHRQIAVISGPRQSRGDNDSSVRRVSAFSAVAASLGASVTEVFAPGWDPGSGLGAACELLTAKPEVTAIYATTVMLAFGVMRAAHRLGLAIPARLSVISLHDTEVAAYVEPPLTTVALPMEELGELAVERLLARIDGHEVGHEVVPTDPVLVLRESTAPPADRA